MTTTTTRYHCISIDPPWLERGSGRVKRGADRHYALLPTPKILEVIAAAEPWARRGNNAHVWLWAPSWRVATGEAGDVLRALGVRPVRQLVWVKDRIGIGQYARGAHEVVVLGVLGKLPPLETARRTSDVVAAPHPKDEKGRRIHSAKPPEVYAAIEAISPGPRLELFARRHRPGWDGWGDEVDREIGAPAETGLLPRCPSCGSSGPPHPVCPLCFDALVDEGGAR